jgi:hypothetical protein
MTFFMMRSSDSWVQINHGPTGRDVARHRVTSSVPRGRVAVVVVIDHARRRRWRRGGIDDARRRLCSTGSGIGDDSTGYHTQQSAGDETATATAAAGWRGVAMVVIRSAVITGARAIALRLHREGGRRYDSNGEDSHGEFSV